MNKGEYVQSYIMRVFCLRDQLQFVGEQISDRELVVVTLQGLPPIWEIFITTLSNNNVLPSFDELVGKCTQEEAMMIARGRIQKHEEGEPSAFATQNKKRKGRGRTSGSRRSPLESKDSNKRLRDIK